MLANMCACLSKEIQLVCYCKFLDTCSQKIIAFFKYEYLYLKLVAAFLMLNTSAMLCQKRKGSKILMR